MSIYLQKTRLGRESYRVIVKDDTYTFAAGFSVKKYGRVNAMLHAEELKSIALDKNIALPTRRRLFNERREQLKCQI